MNGDAEIEIDRIIETHHADFEAIQSEFRHVLSVIAGTSGTDCVAQAEDIVWDAELLLKTCPAEMTGSILGIKAVAGSLGYRLAGLAVRIKLVAQGIEARRAETALAGSVHESPVAESDARHPPHP